MTAPARALAPLLVLLCLAAALVGCSSSSGSDESGIERIKESGVLRIGTEGTYAPFSYHDPATGKLVGPVSTAFDFYARTTSLEFCYGIGVYYVLAWCERRKARLADSAAFKLVVPLALIASVVALVLLEKHLKDDVPRYLAGGIPAAVIVLSALLLERILGIFSRSRLAWLLGEASYVIYLIHPYIVFGVLRLLLPRMGELSLAMDVIVIAGLIALTSTIGIAIHLLFEKPVMAYLRGRLAPDAPAQSAVA